MVEGDGAGRIAEGVAKLEGGVFGDEGAGEDGRARRPFAFHQHPLARAHHLGRTFAKNVPARFGDFSRIPIVLQFGEYDEVVRVGRVEGEAEACEQRLIAGARRRLTAGLFPEGRPVKKGARSRRASGGGRRRAGIAADRSLWRRRAFREHRLMRGVNRADRIEWCLSTS